MKKIIKKCVEEKGNCTNRPDTCPSVVRGKECPYFVGE